MDEDLARILSGLVRIGTVSDTDANRGMVRLLYQSENMTSGWLYVLQTNADAWMPKINDTVLAVFLPVYDGDGFVIGSLGEMPENMFIPKLSSAAPLVDGAASAGSSEDAARADHVHPTDTSRLPVNGTAHKAFGLPKGQLDATSTATVMTAQIDGVTEYFDGLTIILTNGVITSASGFTLEINGLGAKPVYSTLAAASRATTLFNVAYTFIFTYNAYRVEGGCWDVQYGYDSNSNTIGYQLRSNSLSLPMHEKVYRYRLLFTSANGEKFVASNASTSTNATASRAVNQTPIDPHGRIVYYGTTAAVDAGSRPGATYLWTQYKITLGYSFNRSGAALALTSWKPVYVKAAPQADGSAIIDDTTPYVQALPTSQDGKIYIFLGIAVSATEIELLQEHPVYCFRAGGIQLWTGIQAELDALAARVAVLEQ